MIVARSRLLTPDWFLCWLPVSESRAREKGKKREREGCCGGLLRAGRGCGVVVGVGEGRETVIKGGGGGREMRRKRERRDEIWL